MQRVGCKGTHDAPLIILNPFLKQSSQLPFDFLKLPPLRKYRTKHHLLNATQEWQIQRFVMKTFSIPGIMVLAVFRDIIMTPLSVVHKNLLNMHL